jgi:hypothetical protein
MTRNYVLIAIPCFGIVLLSNFYSCKKEPDTTATVSPIDSITTLQTDSNDTLPIDSTFVKVTASKNSIDSIIGTYYGRRERHDTNFSYGIAYPQVDFSGLDTIDVVRVGTDEIGLNGRRNHGYGQLFVYTFTFDTTRVLSDRNSNATLYLFPEKDSISYVSKYYSHSVALAYRVSGWVVTNSFVGKK